MSSLSQRRRPLSLPVILLAAACQTSPVTPATLITNVAIYDGTGSAPVTGAVRIVGDTIAAVGQLARARGDSVIDAKGLALAPGFIDTHSHHDDGLGTRPDALGAVSQGITTIVAGQDGGHSVPLRAAFDSLTTHPVAINVASYVGHGTVRALVLGADFRRKATAAEVDSMSRIVRREMGAGALGLSSGLEYDPGIYSDRSEVLALAKAAADSGGRYISHIRSEDRWFWDAIDEIIAIGKATRMPVQVSHMKLAMTNLWGKADSLTRLLDAARGAGVDISADVYPYPYWQSTLTVLFPKRDFANRKEAEKILAEIAKPEGLLIGRFKPNPEYAGKTVAEIATLRHEDPATTLMALIRISQEMRKKNPGDESVESVVATSMTEDDVAKLLAWPHTNFSSDGELDGAHPRGFGTYPRILGRYVRERHVMALEAAIRKASSLAAQHMGIARRGTIKPGYFADLVLFDPATVIDRATPADPHALSVGIERVWVNGGLVYDHQKPTGAHPGRGHPARRPMKLAERIEAAERRIRPYVRETPLIHSPALSERAGAELYLKLENLQRTGSFKARGAVNKLLSLSAEDRARGVVTASTGNHGAATALAGTLLGVGVTVYVPHIASPTKVDRIRKLGGRVEFFGQDSGETEIHAREAALRSDRVFVSPYNDLDVVAGQGTIGVELLRQEPALDAAVIALGGGGLLAGVASYLKSVKPDCWVVGASPRNSAVMIESIRRGEILDLPSLPTLSDGTAGGVEPGSITFDLCREAVDQFDLVDEPAIAAAMRLLYEEERLVVEGAAGVALATALEPNAHLKGRRVAVLLCGGNLGWDVVEKVLGSGG